MLDCITGKTKSHRLITYQCNTALNLYNTFLINTPPLSTQLAARPAITIAFFCCCPKHSYFSKHFFRYQASCSLAPLMMMLFQHHPRKKKKERSCKPLLPLPPHTHSSNSSCPAAAILGSPGSHLEVCAEAVKHKGMLLSAKQSSCTANLEFLSCSPSGVLF